jgi:hypothetical protein
MSRHRKRNGDGTAWFVADRLTRDYLCYWYVGRGDGHLVESERVATAAAAVTWGRLRTPRVRIRNADGQSQWAGSAKRSEELADAWADPDGTSSALTGDSLC